MRPLLKRLLFLFHILHTVNTIPSASLLPVGIAVKRGLKICSEGIYNHGQ